LSQYQYLSTMTYYYYSTSKVQALEAALHVFSPYMIQSKRTRSQTPPIVPYVRIHSHSVVDWGRCPTTSAHTHQSTSYPHPTYNTKIVVTHLPPSTRARERAKHHCCRCCRHRYTSSSIGYLRIKTEYSSTSWLCN